MKSRILLPLAGGLVLLLAGRAAPAAVETVTVSRAPGAPGYDDAVSNIPRFDASLGILESVTLRVAGTGGFVQMFENTGSFSEPVVIMQSLQLGIELRDPNWLLPRPVMSVSQYQSTEYRPAAFDGHVDFAGSSGGTYTYPLNVAAQVTLLPANDLSPFIGQGFVDLYLSADGTLQRVLGGTGEVAEGSITAGADITVTYEYSAIIPEPAAWSLAGIVLLGGAWAGHYRRSRRAG